MCQPVKDSKKQLRRELRSRRLGLTARQRTLYDKSIQQHVLKLVGSLDAGSVACFWPFDGEPDIIPAARQMLLEERVLALPVISKHASHLMSFHAWDAGSALVENKFGIFEPQDSAAVMPLAGFDMLLMPLVGYDRLGNRLGMGAGFYDRHLESLRESRAPLRVGIAYGLQEIEPFVQNHWDVPMHGIINEHGWFTFGG